MDELNNEVAPKAIPGIKPKKRQIWLWVIFILLLLVIAAGSYVFVKKGDLTWSSIKSAFGKEEATQDVTAEVTVEKTVIPDGWESYTNNTYGFSFAYPQEWKTTKTEVTTETATGITGKALVLKVKFYDPANKLQIDCANNKFQNWADAAPTQTECQPVLAQLSAAEITNLTGPRSPKNVYVRVYAKDSSFSNLSNWLTSTFKLAGGELADYEVGKLITLGGLNGFYSASGCCAGVDNNYVIESGNYIYSLGTSYFETSLSDKTVPAIFSQIADTFKLIKVNPTADWKTYTNSTRGFSFKYPNNWELSEINNADGDIVKIISPENKKEVENKQNIESYANNLVVSYWSSINEDLARGGQWEGQRQYTSLDDYLNDSRSPKQKIGTVQVAGQTGYGVTIGGYGSNYGVMIERNGIYELSFSSTDAKAVSGDEKTVLETFTFTK